MKIIEATKTFEETVTLGDNNRDFATVRTVNGNTWIEFRKTTYSMEQLEQILATAQEIDIESTITWEAMNRSEIEWPEEKRMDIIGQNGNDGDHYEKIYCDFLANNC